MVFISPAPSPGQYNQPWTEPRPDLACPVRMPALRYFGAEGNRHRNARYQVEEVIAVEAFRFRRQPYVAGKHVALQHKRGAVASLDLFHLDGRAMQTKLFVIHEIECFAVVSVLKQLRQQHDLGWIMSTKQFLVHSSEHNERRLLFRTDRLLRYIELFAVKIE